MRLHRYSTVTVITAASCIAASLSLGFAPIGLSAATAAPLPPAEAGLEYRVQGGAWSPTPPALFSESWRAVPGATITTSLDIRSSRPGTTVMAVYLGQTHFASTELRAASALAVDGAAVDMSAAGAQGCELVTEQTVLTENSVLTLPVSFTLSPDLTTMQGAEFSFSLLVAASDTGPTTLSNGCPVDPVIVRAFPVDSTVPDESAEPEALSSTGSGQHPLLWVAGAAALASGVAALLTRRIRPAHVPRPAQRTDPRTDQGES